MDIMGESVELKELSMAEVASHDHKDSTWLVIKDVNDGGEPMK